jgi:hypothetical protein
MGRWRGSHKLFPSPFCLSCVIVFLTVLTLRAPNSPAINEVLPEATFAASADVTPYPLSQAGAVALLRDGKIVATGSAPSVIDGVQYAGIGVVQYNSGKRSGRIAPS